MSNSYELMDRILKHEPVHKFLILDKKGTRISPEPKEEDKKPDFFSSDYTSLPKLVEKSISVARDMNPLV